MKIWPLAILTIGWAAGCGDDGGDDSAPTAETGADDTSTGETGQVDDTAQTDDTGETGETGDTAPPLAPPVEGVTYRLHTEIESIAYVTWDQLEDATVRVAYSVDAGEWRTSPTFEATAGPQEQILLGLPYETEVTYQILSESELQTYASEGHLLITGPLPEHLPIPTLIDGDSAAWEPSGEFLLTSINDTPGGWTGGNYWTVIIDRQGRVVWSLPTPKRHWTLYARPSYDGTEILYDQATYWAIYDGGDASQIHRIKIDGSVVGSYAAPGLHHAFLEMPDNSLIWGAADSSTETLERLNPDGTQETIWDCRDYHEEFEIVGSCQSNSIWWEPSTEVLYFSFYTSESVVEIDYATGATLRHFGHTPGAWGFDPEESAFWWQHGPSITPDGTFLISTKNESWGDETLVREYAFDDENRVLQEVWSFGEGEGIYGSTDGEAHRLANGNTLHNYGSASRLREITPDKRVVWDVEWDEDRLMGRSTFIEDLYPLAP